MDPTLARHDLNMASQKAALELVFKPKKSHTRLNSLSQSVGQNYL